MTAAAAWGLVFFEDQDASVPARDFLDACPAAVAAKILAVLDTVRRAPPPAFSGGGMWEAMSGAMSGCYEVRVQGPGRRHYRLFCLLENGDPRHLSACGFDGPRIVLIDGGVKANATLFKESYYRTLRRKADAYRAALPRPIAFVGARPWHTG